MCNFRNTTNVKHDCTSCKSFTSYQEEFSDELEPSEFGQCSKNIAEIVGVEMVCDLWQSRYFTTLET